MFLRRGLQWLHDKVTTKARNFLLKVLASGPIPKHVAFVMDGNRRYARMNDKAIQQGHSDGFIALRRMLEVCLRLNVQCVSAYAFAIENFKRSEQEVAALMSLAEEKLVELCEHGDLLDEYGVRLNVVGKTELLPESVQKAVQKAENMTRHNNRAILNLCMPYASRDEMALAVESCIQDSVTKKCDNSYILEDHIDSQLLTSLGGSPPLDVLVRTSGVKRLSDFMLWQCSEDTQLQFSSTYWPDFGLLDFIPIILDYQQMVWSKRLSS
ncbi:Decaprenyl diphosphate synthase-like protein [Flammula alnicola]|nr:Decaprenyl diphosphate synthase-like protein [Flammula alnicola]